MHPHSLEAAFLAINPGEARIGECYGGTFDSRFNYEASLFDGEPVVAHGRTREECAANAFEDPRVWAYLGIWDE